MSEDVIRCKLGELEDCIGGIMEKDPPVKNLEIKDPDYEDALIITEGIVVHVPELRLRIRTADFCRYDEAEELYMPDFSMTLVYDEAEEDPGKYLMWSQDSPLIVLFDYFCKRDVSMGYLENLECIVDLELEQ